MRHQERDQGHPSPPQIGLNYKVEGSLNLDDLSEGRRARIFGLAEGAKVSRNTATWPDAEQLSSLSCAEPIS